MKSLQPSFSQFRKIQASNVLRQKEIPIEHYISLPLPVIAHGKNGYGYFACPTRRIVGEPGTPVQVEYGGVDRTWILSADGGALLKYDLVDAPATATLTDPGNGASIAALKEMLTRVDKLMDELAPDFFQHGQADPTQKQELLRLLQSLIPAAIYPFYQQTSAGFLDWLAR